MLKMFSLLPVEILVLYAVCLENKVSFRFLLPLLPLIASNTLHNDYWVIDLGAMDHMTYSSQSFIAYKPCPNIKKNSKLQMALSVSLQVRHYYFIPLSSGKKCVACTQIV